MFLGLGAASNFLRTLRSLRSLRIGGCGGGGVLRGLGGLGGGGFAFAGLEEFPERGDKEGAYRGVHGHAEYYGGSEAYAACGSGPGGEEHGHHAEYEGEGCHHDGAETDVACLLRSLHRGHARVGERAGVFDDKNGVFRGHAEQQYYAYLGVDTDALSHYDAAENGSENGGGCGDDDGERIGP